MGHYTYAFSYLVSKSKDAKSTLNFTRNLTHVNNRIFFHKLPAKKKVHSFLKRPLISRKQEIGYQLALQIILNQCGTLCICMGTTKNNCKYIYIYIYLFRRDSNCTQYQLTIFLTHTFLKYVMVYQYIYMIQNLIGFKLFSFFTQ